MANGEPLTVGHLIDTLVAQVAGGEVKREDWVGLQTDPEGNGYRPVAEAEPALYEPRAGFRGGELRLPPGRWEGDEFIPDDPAAPVPIHVKVCVLLVPGYDPQVP